MLDDPDISCYIGSETHPKAKEFLSPIKSMLDGSDPHSLFSWLYGVWYSPERTWTVEQVVTSYRRAIGVTEPSIGTFGVETGMTGKHPLLTIYDDPISEEKIKEGGTFLQAAVDSVDAIYPALENDSLFILVGTHYRDDDPIGYVLSQDGVREWQGHVPVETWKQGGNWRVYFLQARDTSNTANFPKGEPVLPEAGWTDKNLLQYERITPEEYAAQMMGTPSIGEHMELTRQQIDTLLLDRKDLPPIEYATIHLDTAFKNEDRRGTGDRNVIIRALHDLRPNGMVYIDKVLASSQWRAEDFDTQLINVLSDCRANGWRVRAITDEKEMGGKSGMYRRHLEDIITAANLRTPEIIQLNRAGKNKTMRIRVASNYWIEGLVRLTRDCGNLPYVYEEMSRIGKSRHDDVADALADVWHPGIWRGRARPGVDGQPPTPRQPGDDVLKGKLEQEYRDIEYELRHGRSREEGRVDFQPFDDLMDRGSW